MPTYNGIEVTEDFYAFFAPHLINLISPIWDPREQDNVNLHYSLSSYLSVIILGIPQRLALAPYLWHAARDLPADITSPPNSAG